MPFLHLSFFWPPVNFSFFSRILKKWNFPRYIQNKFNWDQNKHLPGVLHVLRLIHPHSKLDLQVLIRAVFGNSHFVPLWLLWAIWSRVENNLQASKTTLKGKIIHKMGFNGEQKDIRWATFPLKVSLEISIYISEDGILLFFLKYILLFWDWFIYSLAPLPTVSLFMCLCRTELHYQFPSFKERPW